LGVGNAIACDQEKECGEHWAQHVSSVKKFGFAEKFCQPEARLIERPNRDLSRWIWAAESIHFAPPLTLRQHGAKVSVIPGAVQ